jgi:hypothetical protein
MPASLVVLFLKRSNEAGSQMQDVGSGLRPFLPFTQQDEV